MSKTLREVSDERWVVNQEESMLKLGVNILSDDELPQLLNDFNKAKQNLTSYFAKRWVYVEPLSYSLVKKEEPAD